MNLPLCEAFAPAITLRRPATLVATSSSAPGPPMSVRTQPGLNAMQTTPLGPSSLLAARSVMFSAALLARYSHEKDCVVRASEPRPLDRTASLPCAAISDG